MRLKEIVGTKLVKAGIWYSIGNTLVKGMSFLSIPILVSLASVGEYGLINNFTALVTIFAAIVGLSLNSAVANAYFDEPKRIDSFISAILALGYVTLFGVLAVANLAYFGLDEIFSLNRWIGNLMLLQAFGLFVISVVQAEHIVRSQQRRYIVLSAASVVLSLGVAVGAMLLLPQEHFEAYAIGSTLGVTILALVCSVRVFARGRDRSKKAVLPRSVTIDGACEQPICGSSPKPQELRKPGKRLGSLVLYDKSFWKYALRISVPVVPHLVSGLLIAQLGRIIVNQYLGAEQAGVYAFFANIGAALNVLWASANNAWVPWFYQRMTAGNLPVIRRVGKYYTWAYTALTLLAVGGAYLLAITLSPPSYQPGIDLVLPICVSYFFQFSYSLFVNIEFYRKKTWLIAIGTLSSGLLAIVLSLWLTPWLGMMGAAWAALASYAILFVFHYVITTFVMRERIFDPRWVFGSVALITLFFFALTALSLQFTR